jgi:hypothetical protein
MTSGTLGSGDTAVPSTPDAIAFMRAPREVQYIVYSLDQKGVSRGGFYPNGRNGALRAT